MADEFKYEFKGATIHDMLTVSEQVRKKIATYPADQLTQAQRAEIHALQELKDALGEYVYQQTLLMDQQQNNQ
ncbi:MAG: hypothetical protein PHP63_07510 [Candidatus Marinimicrobia bacterium]|jgi:hypothetical protein|nr:hypothetical protein [Candidatus Neomarinimicrobiota bacterium]